MQPSPNRTIPVRCNLIVLASFALYFCPKDALAVHPFVTDDARIIYKGQLVNETYSGMTMVQGDKPALEARSLHDVAIIDRFELTTGGFGFGFGFSYQDNHARSLDMLIQSKYVLHSSLGAIPSVSVTAARYFPSAAIASIGMGTPWRMSAGFC